MSARIEDYAMIGDLHTAALVSREGSIDWLCLPRFDSPACFAALLGNEEHGRWQIRPQGKAKITRRYRPGTLVLETDFETEDGTVTIVDCMPPRRENPAVIRLVKGRRGRVPMRMQLILRFDYGSIVPWVKHHGNGLRAIAGPDRVCLASDGVEVRGEEFTTVAEFDVSAGDCLPFVLTWHASYDPTPEEIDAAKAVEETERWWREWSDRCRCEGRWCAAAKSSLIALKALIYAPTGGMVAAPTTSLPEKIGGERNWDYRYCWLRDATFTLYALMGGGYIDEAAAWRQWLLRAVAGQASQMNIMYGLAGERRLTENELDWLPGYERSRPVRAGNAAYKKFQLDVFGEILDALHLGRRYGLAMEQDAWDLQLHLIEQLEKVWQ